MAPENYLPAGKIVAAHGIKGEVRVYPFLRQRFLFSPGKKVLVEPPGSPASYYTVENARALSKTLGIRLEAVNDRNKAEALVGSGLFLPRSALPPAEPGEWYWCDLIGLEVHDAREGLLGRVEAMIETGANDVIVVRNGDHERLIPAVEQVVKNIDPASGLILVDMPEGL